LRADAKINFRNNSSELLFTYAEQFGEASETGHGVAAIDKKFEADWKGAHMKNILRTLALTGVVAAAAVVGQAQAQAQVGIAVQVGPPAPVAYIPPCPGVDFIWTPGYYAGTVWVPGRWVHHDRVYVARPYYHYDHRGWYGRR
jgi:hypothetical protein